VDDRAQDPMYCKKAPHQVSQGEFASPESPWFSGNGHPSTHGLTMRS
jgi:hypothetical protein